MMNAEALKNTCMRCGRTFAECPTHISCDEAVAAAELPLVVHTDAELNKLEDLCREMIAAEEQMTIVEDVCDSDDASDMEVYASTEHDALKTLEVYQEHIEAGTVLLLIEELKARRAGAPS